jgi:autotransporter-associated beta strand protein
MPLCVATRLVALILIASGWIVSTVRASTFDWNNTGTDFNAAASWTNENLLGPSGPPGLNDIASFVTPELSNPVATNTSTQTILGLNFGVLGTGYTLSSVPNAILGIGSSGISAANITGTNSITAELLLNFDQSITQVAGGTLNITGPVRLGGGIDTTRITIGSTGTNGVINFSPSSAEIGNDINLVTNVSATLPAVVSETLGAGIIKSGAATLTMTGASTYDGPTAINAGTLLASNGSNGSATGTGNVSVNNGGILGGTGRLAGATSVNAGGSITGANVGGVGTLKLDNNLAFTGASGNVATYLVDLSGMTSDKITVGGALDLSGSFDRLLFSGSTDGTSSYVLATYASRSGIFDTVTSLPMDYTLLYKTNELDLVPLSSVPETGTAMAGALALVSLFVMQRRRIARLLKHST